MIAQMIATIASAIAAVCNIILIILLYRWYGVTEGKRQRHPQPPESVISHAVSQSLQDQPRRGSPLISDVSKYFPAAQARQSDKE